MTSNIHKTERQLKVALVSVSDRASTGDYQDRGIPALEQWLERVLITPFIAIKRLIADDKDLIIDTLTNLVDMENCDLVLTTGGTGPARRDLTPDATLAVGSREMPGFGEQMRQVSLNFVPTAILSRQVAVIRDTGKHAALIINLPGQPKAIAETLEGLRDKSGQLIVPGVFAAVPYCLDLIDGPYIDTDANVVKSFRPKSS